MKDNHNNIFGAVAINPTQENSNTTLAGNIIDRNDYESVEFLIWMGTSTTGLFTPTLTDGNTSNLADGAVVADTYVVPNALNQATGAGYTQAAINTSNSVKRLGYVGAKRYVQLSLVSTSVVSTGALVGALAILGSPDFSPTAAN